MSAYVFPSYLPGIAWPVKRTPQFATHIQQALSGKESRIALKQYPQYLYEMDVAILRDDLSFTNHVYNSESNTSCAYGTNTTSSSTIDVLAPDGTYTAVKVVYTGGGTAGQTIIDWPTDIASASASSSYTVSVWLRTLSGTVQVVLGNNQAGTPPTVTVTTAWQRFTYTSVGSAAALQVAIRLPSGSSSAVTVYAAYPQAEVASYAGYYIPTYSAAAVTNIDYRTLVGFYTQMQGQWDTFLFQDNDWCTETGQQFGTGDGTTTQFQLVAQYSAAANGIAGFDLVQNLIPFSGLAIYVNGTLKTLTTDYTVGSTGIITFTAAPAASAVITWTGSFYQRCRFMTDEQEFSQMMKQWWEVKQLQLLSVKV